MAYINGFKNSVKTLPLYSFVEEKFRTKMKDKDSLYSVLFDSHCVKSDVIPYVFLW